MRLRSPCPHDRYEAHAYQDLQPICPGGELLGADERAVELVALAIRAHPHLLSLSIDEHEIDDLAADILRALTGGDATR